MTLPQKSGQTRLKSKLSHRWRVRNRLILSILFALILSFFLPSQLSLTTHILVIWDGGMIFFLVSTWILMLQAIPKKMRCNAQSQDEGRLVILSLITAAACASILAIAFILKETQGKSASVLIFHLILSVITIVGLTDGHKWVKA